MNNLHRLASAISRKFAFHARTAPCLPSEASSGQVRMAVGAAVLLTLMGLGCEFLIWPDWDAAWLLAIARRMQAGATLGADFAQRISSSTLS